MRSFVPVMPPKDPEKCHPEVYRILKNFSDWALQADAAFAKVSRNQTPDQGQAPPPTPPGVDDHGNLKGLVPTLNPDGSVADYNDDHTQYPLMFGRPGGQEVYGSRPGAATSWVPSGAFTTQQSLASTSNWTFAIDHTAVVNQGIIMCLGVHIAPETQGAGETNYCTGITDTSGNTWTKLKEFTLITSAGGSAKISSIWFCLVSGALTAGVSTVTAAFSASSDRMAVESYQYQMAAGLSVTLAAYTTNATPNGTTLQPALTLSGLSGESLFVRSMAIQPFSGAYDNTEYHESAGFTEMDATHTNSTTSNTFSARGEFLILTGSGATSQPTLGSSLDLYTTSAIFGAIQIVSSSGNVVVPTPVTGFVAITGGFITTIRTVSESTWSSIPIQTSANAGRLVFLVLATHSPQPTGYQTGVSAVTNFHTGIVDTKLNTWTKLKEYTTSYFGGSEEQTVSLWYSILTSTLAAGTDTLTASLSAAFAKKSIESYQFTLSGGATVSLSTSTTGGAQDADFEALSLSSVSNPAIYIRAIAVHANSGNEATYTPTPGYTAFTSDHTNSTNTSSEVSERNASARGEFLVSTSASSTSNPSTLNANPDSASVFCAITLTSTSPPPNAYLLLGSANLSDASKIILTGRDIKFTAGLGAGDFIFDPLGAGGFTGTLDFDSISGSSKTYVFPNTSGTVALTSDLAAYLKLDASNDPLTGTLDTQIIRPSADNTYDIGDTTHSYKDLYLSSDIIPKTDEVLDIGAIGSGARQLHFTKGTAVVQTLRVGGRGLCWFNTTSDVFVGADNYTGPSGLYVQRVTRTNSSITATGDYREDSSNLIQGYWGGGSTPSNSVLHLNYNCGQAAVGSYPFGEDGATILRDGLVTIGEFTLLSGANVGGGGLLIPMRGGTSVVAGTGLYLSGDEANAAFVFRTMSGGSASTKAGQRITGIWFAGTRLTNISPSVTDVIDLGVATTHRYKNIYYHGTLTSTISGSAISLADGGNVVLGTSTGSKIGTGTTQLLGFYNATPVAQQGATTDLGTALSNLGLRASGTAYPITTSGAVSFTGTIGLGGQVTISDAINFALNTSTGTKIGTGTTQKLGFWNAAPIAQPTTGIAAATFVTNTSLIANDTGTWDGYTVGQVVKALRNAGILA